MIRRIQTTNDLLDVIKSCPSGVIDDIYKIEYYIQGFDTVYEAKFTQEGDCLKVVLPSSELEKLESGILMRRAYYKVSDSSYPDGYYNLTFEDNMNVWLGSGESSDPYERQYVTDKVLNETLEDYALKTEVPSLDGYATQVWVESKGYVTAETLPEGIATQSWVQSQGYLTEHQDLSSYALKTEVPSLDGYATQSWVTNQGYITSVPDTFATKDWVSTQGYLTSHQDLTGYATQTWVSSQQFATQSWVSSQGYLTSHQDLTGYALKSEIPSLDGYATQSWVSSQGYLTSHQDLTGYALKSEIPSLSGYATETWVESKGYLTEHQSLKTINGESIVGEGNIVITGGSSEEVILIPFNRDQLSMTHQELVDNVLNKIDGASAGSYRIFFVSSDRYYYEADTINITHNVSVGGPSGTVNDTGVYIYSNAIRLNFYLKFEDIEFFFDEFAYVSDLEYLSGQVSELESRIPDLTGYATQSWVEGKGYLTEHQSLAGYALKSEIPDVSGYALKSEVPSLTGYATETWVESKGYLTEHQSLADYALKSEIPDVSGYALKTEIPDVSGYALKSEIPSLTGYATESWVTNQGYTTQTYVDNKIGQIDTLLDQMLG